VRETVRVGTRRSRLARLQTDRVLAALARAFPDRRFEAVPLDTSGDRDRSPGRSPDFTDAIDRALLRAEVDLAVHSAKDLPSELDPRLALWACPPRADPHDCLLVAPGLSAHRLPRKARVGSSSPRRRAQLHRWRPDLAWVEIRGNVDTRLERLRSGDLDAIILAVAGLARLRRSREIGRVLPERSFLPAPAQGALALVGRADDVASGEIARRLDHRPTHAQVAAERAFSARIGGDCQVPLGALATIGGGRLSLVGEILAPDGTRCLRLTGRGPIADAGRVGTTLAERMRQRGWPIAPRPERR
jgi:hydroxymethylbilane synthase